MNINNLVFFDRNGESYNFSQDSSGVWQGADYFLPISTALYDVSNIFILENTVSGYRFPALESGSKLIFKWKTADSSENLFLFTVAKEDPHTDSTIYMERQTSITVNYSDLSSGSEDLDLTYPLQINVGFSPTSEIYYGRILEIYYETLTETTQVASISFYGEGEDEDERFRVWLENFGIKFNREDALLLKDYDLKESLPDWKQINQARKELLVNRDQIYPYVGTYKGLINLIDILGYRDVLRVKEYWKDQDTNSAYYNKYAMVDITDLMTVGSIDQVNLVDLNGQIKRGGKFKKTEFLALSYEFSRPTSTFDEDGLPEIEFTTDFEVDEIFYKLNRLSTKLKNEILPVNVVIKDVIGEFIYFNKFNLRNWSDVTYINALEINDNYDLVLNHPPTKSQLLMIRDIKTLYPRPFSNSTFPAITFNTSTTEPYKNGQKYPVTDIPSLLTAIEDYYDNLRNYEFLYHGQSNPMTSEDDSVGKVGCPISIESYIPDFTLGELDGSTFGDFSGSHFTIGNIKYRNGYEIEWEILGPQGYVFNWRQNLTDIVKLPHVLPHVGDYSIKSTVYDLHGGQNVSYLNLTVLDDEPVIEVFTKLQDKNEYRIKNLANVTLGDIGDSPLYLPFANILQKGQSTSVLPSHYLDWNTYSNYFGIGNPQATAEIYTDGIGFEPISGSTNHMKLQWGTGSGDGQPTLLDYSTTTIGELSLTRLKDHTYVADKINGFYLNLVDNPSYDITDINFGDWSSSSNFQVSSYTDAQDLADQLNASTDTNVSNYKYSVINGNIHAQAIRQDKSLHRILLVTDSNSVTRRVYTFCYPYGVYSRTLIDTLNSQLSEIGRRLDDNLLFLDIPFEDMLIRTGETVYSTSSVTIPASYPTTVQFSLTRKQEFYPTSNITKVRATSISDPTKWIEGTITQSDLSSLTMIASNSLGSGNTLADWEFTYVTNQVDQLETYATASEMQYWIDKGFIAFDNTDSANFTTTGYLPSNVDENSFNFSNLKINQSGITVPTGQPVFAAISNIDSKKETVWTLKHFDQEIAKIRSKSFFIWRFDEPGEYSLFVTVKDSNNNTYELSKEFKAVNAGSIDEYKKYVAETLDRRKATL